LSLTGKFNAKKIIHLLYDDTTRHYHLITNVTAAMAKRYVCNGCGKRKKVNGGVQIVTEPDDKV
jgi:hypothetical protein